MGQQDVINYLKKVKEPVSAEQISNKIGIGINSVRRSLKIFRETGCVRFKEETVISGLRFRYKYFL